MFRGKSSFALIGTTFALCFSFANGAILDKRPAAHHDLLIRLAKTMSTTVLPEANKPLAVSGTLTAPPPNCTPSSTCILFFQVSDNPVKLDIAHS